MPNHYKASKSRACPPEEGSLKTLEAILAIVFVFWLVNSILIGLGTYRREHEIKLAIAASIIWPAIAIILILLSPALMVEFLDARKKGA
jgi:hypothetical protein